MPQRRNKRPYFGQRKKKNPSKKIGKRRAKKKPIEENNPEVTTSSEVRDQENLGKHDHVEKATTSVKDHENSFNHMGIKETESHLTDESYTVLEIIDDNEEGNEELHFDKEKDIPTAKRRKLNGQETHLGDALKCMKTYMNKNKKRDEHSLFGELIAHKIRTSNRSHVDIAIAHHHIENVIFNLTMGVYSKISPPASASNNKSKSTIPATNTNFEPLTNGLQYNLIIPKSEPE